MKLIAAGSSAGLLGLFGSQQARAEAYEAPAYTKGMAPVKIKSVKAISTAPKVLTLLLLKLKQPSRDYTVWDVPLLHRGLKWLLLL